MKTTRRQELRTNELSQRIEQIGDYAKQNAAKLVAFFLAGVVVVAAGYWYFHQREQRILDGWATLSRTAVLTEGETPISVFESLAQQDLDPALTAQALLMLGDAAAARLRETAAVDAGSADGNPTDAEDWASKAEAAYTQVVTRFPDDVTASGKAMILLGVLAEDRNNADDARRWYQGVIDNPRYASTAFNDEAAFRLANLEQWSEPIVFAPPIQPAPLPPPIANQPLSLEPSPVPVPPVREVSGSPGASATREEATAPRTPGVHPVPDAGVQPAAETAPPPSGEPAATAPPAPTPTTAPAGDPTPGR